MIISTLGYLLDGDRLLLAMKKRGFGKGFYNGFGGKLEKDEGFEKALMREAEEELGVIPKRYANVADLTFYSKGRKEIFVKVYLITKWEGEPKESEEMKPVWFPVEKIPYDKMWVDDRFWLPKVLEGKKINGKFWFDDIFNKKPNMTKCKIKVAIE